MDLSVATQTLNTIENFVARRRQTRKITCTGVEWAADEDVTQCSTCSTQFNLFTRRHHCRVCGQIFCGPCSSTCVSLPDSDKPQRACAPCVGIVGELVGRPPAEEDDDETTSAITRNRTSPLGQFPVSPASVQSQAGVARAASTPAPGGQAAGSAADLVAMVLEDAREVLERFPSHAFSEALRPCAEQCFEVELPSAYLWEETMGRLRKAGQWPFEGHSEVLQRAGQPLSKLVRPLALAAARRQPSINTREGRSGFSVGDAVRVYDRTAGHWWEDGEVAEVSAADACASSCDPGGEAVGPQPGAVKVVFNGRLCSQVFTEVQARRHVLRSLVGSDESEVAEPVPEDLGEEAVADGSSGSAVPNNLSTRIGGTYHETLALRFVPGEESVVPCPRVGSMVGTQVLHVEGDERQGELLTSCLVQVFGSGGEGCGTAPTLVIGRHGRVDTPVKARQLFELIRFAAARCAPPPWPGRRSRPLRVRICSLLNALVLDGKERAFFQGQLSALTEPAKDRKSEGDGTPPFDFVAAVEGLGADFSCLNFVANWPLCFRLGSGPPAGKHNAQHARGLRRHLCWLAQDVLRALERLPEAPGAALVEARARAEEQKRVLRELCSDDSSGDPWREGLAMVRAGVEALKPFAVSSAAAREDCRRFFMAAELLGELSKCQGTTFRRRAAELLQLCVLEHILGVTPFFNCKSGIDRTGLVVGLWTAVHQLLSSKQPQVWLWHYLALTYPVMVKIVHNVHACGSKVDGGQPSVPLQQLYEGCLLHGNSLLPFPPENEEERRMYAGVEQLCSLCPTGAGRLAAAADADGAAARLAYTALEQLFFQSPEGMLPQLQMGFFANVMGIATKVAVASTGVHGLKYGDSIKNSGQFNSLAAQYMPKAVRCAETGASVAITEVRKGFLSTEVAFAQEVHPHLIGSSCGRGT